MLAGGWERARAAQDFWDKPGEVLATLAGLADLDGVCPDIQRMGAYLERAATLDEELRLDRLSLQEQLQSDALRSNPSVWSSVQAMFEGYRARYVASYARHHRAYRAEMAALRRSLTEAQARAEALRLLNTVKELGPPVGEAAITAVRGLLERAVPCTRPEQELTQLRADPRCPACGVAMEAAPPAQLVQRAIEALDEARVVQHKRLGSEAVRQVLEQPDTAIEQLVQAIQAADPSALDQAMDERVAVFLSAVLGERVVELESRDLIQHLTSRFPKFAAHNQHQVTEAIDSFLKNAVGGGAADLPR